MYSELACGEASLVFFGAGGVTTELFTKVGDGMGLIRECNSALPGNPIDVMTHAVLAKAPPNR
jgi:hypothetical protein